jgi:ferredoxin
MASGHCVAILPDVFMQDEEGVSTVLPDAALPADAELMSEVIAACPSAAISIEDESGSSGHSV